MRQRQLPMVRNLQQAKQESRMSLLHHLNIEPVDTIQDVLEMTTLRFAGI